MFVYSFIVIVSFLLFHEREGESAASFSAAAVFPYFRPRFGTNFCLFLRDDGQLVFGEWKAVHTSFLIDLSLLSRCITPEMSRQIVTIQTRERGGATYKLISFLSLSAYIITNLAFCSYFYGSVLQLHIIYYVQGIRFLI